MESNKVVSRKQWLDARKTLLAKEKAPDMAPKGRDEEGLPYPMAWVRRHDRYDTAR
jgi:predicted dithiol-disulfide oxidoreductase (DUF899 family)